MKNLSIQSVFLTGCLLLFASMSNYPTTLEKTISTEKGGESFAGFLSQFPHVKLPYAVEMSDFKTYEPFLKGVKDEAAFYKQKNESRKNAIKRTRFIPEIAKGHFGRMGPPTVLPVARFYPDENSIVVIYRSAPSFRDEFTELYQMIRYDLNGKIIPFQQDGYTKESIIIGQTSQQEAIAFQIDPNGNIWQSVYKLSWDQKKAKNYYESFKLKETKLTSTQLLQFNSKGVVTVTKKNPVKDRV